MEWVKTNYIFLLFFIVLILFIIAIFLIFFILKRKSENDKIILNQKNKIIEIEKANLTYEEELKKESNILLRKIRDIENLRENLLDDFIKNNNIKDFFNSLANQFISNKDSNDILKFVNDKIIRGDKTKSKFVMTLREFKSDTGWMIVMSLLACSKILDISNAEKQSWFSNFGPLKSLFYNQTNKKNILDNTWLVFEKEIFWNKNFNEPDNRPYRPDLLIVSKVVNGYNLVILELKQWSNSIWNEEKFNERKEKIIKQLTNQKNSIRYNFKYQNINIETLGFFYNSTLEEIKKFNIEMNSKKIYNIETIDDLSKRIYKIITNNLEIKNKEEDLEEFTFDELFNFLEQIGNE